MMLACLSPADCHYEENLSTLQYASQAASIKNQPTLNLDPKDKLIEILQANLAAAHKYILNITGLDELPDELQEVNDAAQAERAPRRCGVARRSRSVSGPLVPHRRDNVGQPVRSPSLQAANTGIRPGGLGSEYLD